MSISTTTRRLAAAVTVLVVTVAPAGVGRATSQGTPTTSHRTPAKAAQHTPFGCAKVTGGVHRFAPGSGRTVALTFDDGPGRDTKRIMAVLAKYRVTATFFNLGANEAQHRSTVRRQQTAGYMLGDHTWDHASLPTLSATAQAREIDRERSEQSSITGALPCLLRPPYGSFNNTTLALAARRHMQIWNWSVDTEDWKAAGSGSSYWVRRVTSRAEAGRTQKHPVILMHNQPGGNPATVAALPSIIRFYKARQYRFVDLHGNTGFPTVSRVTPARGGLRAGTRVTIRGHDFRSVHTVLFGSVPAGTVHVVSSTEISVRAPGHAAGVTHVRVRTDHGNSLPVATDRFTFQATSG